MWLGGLIKDQQKIGYELRSFKLTEKYQSFTYNFGKGYKLTI